MDKFLVLEGAPRIYSVVKGAVDETFKHFVTIQVNNNKISMTKRVLRGRSCSYAAVNQSHLWNINDSRIPMWGLYRSYVPSLVQSHKTTTTSVSCSSRNLIRTLEIVILLLQIFYLLIKMMMMKASSVPPNTCLAMDPVWATARSLAVWQVQQCSWWNDEPDETIVDMSYFTTMLRTTNNKKRLIGLLSSLSHLKEGRKSGQSLHTSNVQ